MNGNFLLRLLNSTNKPELFAGSIYVIGFNDGVSAADAVATMAADKQHPRVFCVPGGANNEQEVDIVRQYLIQHPESRHLDAGLLVGMALRQAWPCP